jgi:hypothetical protein
MKTSDTTVTLQSLALWVDLSPPIIGGLKMPKDLWWMTLVASRCTGADPLLVAVVMRFESDFRCGPIGRGTYIGPMGIYWKFYKKYPITDIFGNILTGARRLSQFENIRDALAGYNKDRSPEYREYCNSILQAYRKLKEEYAICYPNSYHWNICVGSGLIYLLVLEREAEAFTSRGRNPAVGRTP